MAEELREAAAERRERVGQCGRRSRTVTTAGADSKAGIFKRRGQSVGRERPQPVRRSGRAGLRGEHPRKTRKREKQLCSGGVRIA